MSIGVFLLAMGILLAWGWLGTTCLDEWQIGILGVSSGFTLFLTGSGAYSLDNYLRNKYDVFNTNKLLSFSCSSELSTTHLKIKVLTVSIFIFGLTLFTNQYFHGGVFGKLHNKSVKPKVEISHIRPQKSQLTFQIFRVEGADVYGSFLIGIEILDENRELVLSINQNQVAQFPKDKIHNHYVAKVKPGKHSLIIPLGAKADITIDLEHVQVRKNYLLKLTDISGIEWTAKI
jgi:hypothetical protein